MPIYEYLCNQCGEISEIIVATFLELPVVEEENAAIHLPVQMEESAEKINKGGRSRNVSRF